MNEQASKQVQVPSPFLHGDEDGIHVCDGIRKDESMDGSNCG